MFGRVGGALATGGLVGFLTWMLIAILGISIAAGIVAFIFSLLGGLGGGGGRRRLVQRPAQPRVGLPGRLRWRRLGRRRFGGGGWSGGGGGFGGGGASGGW